MLVTLATRMEAGKKRTACMGKLVLACHASQVVLMTVLPKQQMLHGEQ